MTPTSIKAAFDHVDVEPSAVFRDRLRAEFVAALTATEPDKALIAAVDLATLNHDDADNNGEVGEIMTVTIENPAKPRRANVLIGVAAAIILGAVLTSVVLVRRDEPNSVESTNDAAIAESALLSAEQLEGAWTVLPIGSPTPRDMADIAANVPACAPYVDYAFDSPRRNSVTTERDFQGELKFPLVQQVYIFPTEAAATEAMNKIAEPGFVPCFNAFIDSLIAATSGGVTADIATFAAPPFADHGDRQVVIPQSIAYRGGAGTFTIISFYVQVGRGIVYIDPTLRKADPLDTKGHVEKTVAAATDALADALDASSG